MQAYEFETVLTDGVIKLPLEFVKKIKPNVKVIILGESRPESNKASNQYRRTDLLSPISIDTRGWRFDKDEANER